MPHDNDFMFDILNVTLVFAFPAISHASVIRPYHLTKVELGEIVEGCGIEWFQSF